MTIRLQLWVSIYLHQDSFSLKFYFYLWIINIPKKKENLYGQCVYISVHIYSMNFIIILAVSESLRIKMWPKDVI